MDILYCGDEKIEDGLILSILSLLKNVKEPLHIFVLT
ncbi:MAG TPA: glycosyl transferase, partial [Lachnospiraceae bacterium]|nr:glycosyl transferase [Lachnospiraceae bacterium]